jgi:ribosomal-protein-serine acetyltransferase
MQIRVSESLALRPVSEDDVTELDKLIAGNREHLSQFMPWAESSSIDATRVFVRKAIEQERDADGFHGVMVENGAIIGVAGHHHVDRNNESTALGYWMAADHQGRGLMTATVAALVDHAFDTWKLNRVELRIAPNNTRSRAIAARLGFREEGVLRGAERFGDGDYRDLIMHSLLRSDPRPAGD